MNKSNFHPIGSRLMVYIDSVEKVEQSKSGLIIKANQNLLTPEEQAYRATTGILIELGDGAFANKTPPQLYDRLVFKPYAGIHIVGDDANYYRILEDKEINAIHRLENEVIAMEEHKSLKELQKEQPRQQSSSSDLDEAAHLLKFKK